MDKVAVVARSFQAGTGENGKPFDGELFERLVAEPIDRLLRAEVVQNIIVVVNCEPGNKLAELPGRGIPPTVKALFDRFTKKYGSKITPSICTDWGPNPGSGIALNQGLEMAKQKNMEWVLNWSPEIEMDGSRIELGIVHAEKHNLSIVGFLRQGYWERPQWQVPQNTASLWNVNMLSAVKGFAKECNGTGRTVKTAEYGDVPLAGMEDFHAILRMLKQFPNLRWGMVGRAEPLFWDTDFQGERLATHLKKVARQYQVMQIWVQDIFPELSFNQVMNRLFARCHID